LPGIEPFPEAVCDQMHLLISYISKLAYISAVCKLDPLGNCDDNRRFFLKEIFYFRKEFLYIKKVLSGR